MYAHHVIYWYSIHNYSIEYEAFVITYPRVISVDMNQSLKPHTAPLYKDKYLTEHVYNALGYSHISLDQSYVLFE